MTDLVRSPVSSDALDEFAGAVKIARDDLDLTIADIVPDEFFEAEYDDGNYKRGALVVDACEDINQAFANFDWTLERALRALRQKLARNT